jgi:hypothetical protein
MKVCNVLLYGDMIQIGYNGWMSDDQKDVKPWDLINGSPKSPDELAAYRLKICQTCEFFRPKTQTCKKCGCFMKLKTTLEKAKCPMDKW